MRDGLWHHHVVLDSSDFAVAFYGDLFRHSAADGRPDRDELVAVAIASGFLDSLEDEFAALHRAIDGVPPGSNGVLFLPWLTGSMSPAEDGKVRGGFLNMSIGTTRRRYGPARCRWQSSTMCEKPSRSASP